MSLQSRPIPPIPHLTAKVARRAFRKGNVYMQMRDVLGTFFSDDQFSDLYPADGQPAYAPWRLALVSILQFAETVRPPMRCGRALTGNTLSAWN